MTEWASSDSFETQFIERVVKVKPQRKFASIEEIAEGFMGASRAWFYGRLKSGDAPPVYRIAGRIFLDLDEVGEWVRSHRVPWSEVTVSELAGP